MPESRPRDGQHRPRNAGSRTSEKSGLGDDAGARNSMPRQEVERSDSGSRRRHSAEKRPRSSELRQGAATDGAATTTERGKEEQPRALEASGDRSDKDVWEKRSSQVQVPLIPSKDTTSHEPEKQPDANIIQHSLKSVSTCRSDDDDAAVDTSTSDKAVAPVGGRSRRDSDKAQKANLSHTATDFMTTTPVASTGANAAKTEDTIKIPAATVAVVTTANDKVDNQLILTDSDVRLEIVDSVEQQRAKVESDAMIVTNNNTIISKVEGSPPKASSRPSSAGKRESALPKSIRTSAIKVEPSVNGKMDDKVEVHDLPTQAIKTFSDSNSIMVNGETKAVSPRESYTSGLGMVKVNTDTKEKETRTLMEGDKKESTNQSSTEREKKEGTKQVPTMAIFDALKNLKESGTAAKAASLPPTTVTPAKPSEDLPQSMATPAKPSEHVKSTTSASPPAANITLTNTSPATSTAIPPTATIEPLPLPRSGI